jgi:hypothetical protein
MSTDEKIIKNKVGLLKLAEMLGSVSEACRYLLSARIFTPKALILRIRKAQRRRHCFRPPRK